MLSVSWVDFNTWGLLSAVTPFAFANVTSDGGAKFLAVAYELGSIALVVGSLSTIYFRLRFSVAVAVFSAFALTIYAAAMGTRGFSSSAAAPMLVVVFTGSRFLEAHILTAAYRGIASEVEGRHRETAARTVSLCDLAIQTLGTSISTIVVSKYAHC